MTTYIALLRAVNVSGTQIQMSALRDLVARLGFTDVRSVLQSGNVVFKGTGRTAAGLERLLEAELRKRLGLQADVFVRTAPEWAALVGDNPFPAEAKRDPAHLLVLFLKDAPGAGAVKALQAGIRGREVVRARGKQAFVVYPDGIGRSRLTNAVIEKTLGTRATGRNWNTVLRLAALAKES